MKRRIVMVGCVLVPMAFGACVSPDDNTMPDAAGYDASPYDGALPGYDAGADHFVPIDANVIDANAPDTTVPDAHADTSVPDAKAADTSVPDSNVTEVSTADTSVPETSTPDSNVPDVVIAPLSCITAIYGDHYVTTAGQVFRVDGSAQTEVVYDADDSSLGTITSIVQQQDHACGLRDDGTVWCWALPGFVNNDGDLGNGKIDPTNNYNLYRATQVQVDPGATTGPVYLTDIASISEQSDTFYTFPTCAIKNDKSLYCWGFSTQGNIFQGTTGTTSSSPYALAMAAGPKPSDGGAAPIISADQVAVGNRHVCTLLNGVVSCFGANVSGNLGTGDTTFHIFPVPVDTTTGLPAAIESISVGYDFTCARSAGAVWCFGTAGASQEGNTNVPTDICNLNYCHNKPVEVQTALADGGASTTALTGVTQLRTGYQFGCGLDTAGSMRCWGSTNAGVTSEAEATPYANPNTAIASSPIRLLTAWGEDNRSAPRYVLNDGTYVVGNQVVVPQCAIVVGGGGGGT